jgi:hypothetical protein
MREIAHGTAWPWAYLGLLALAVAVHGVASGKLTEMRFRWRGPDDAWYRTLRHVGGYKSKHEDTGSRRNATISSGLPGGTRTRSGATSAGAAP